MEPVMRTNVAVRLPPILTHGGATAARHVPPLAQLRRSVLAHMLFEGEFYEDGKSAADRIVEHARAVSPQELAAVAVEARAVHNLRHVPLLLTSVLADTGRVVPGLVSSTLEQVIWRADELGEFVSLYWRGGKTPLSAQVKKGLAAALRKFDAYQLAKYDRAAKVRLRDVLFLTHAKPADEAQAELWKKLAANELAAPDTWEVALSGGADKAETFARLLRDRKLGYLALLRNLRGMVEAGVDVELIRQALAERRGADRVLPFRYTAAARACPQLEPAIDQALVAAINGMSPLPGKTLVMVDVSGSMFVPLSSKSDLTRADAAATLAAIIPGNVRVFSFSDSMVEVPPRRGMAGVDAVLRSQPHSGTALAQAVAMANIMVPHDRIIVITDEQATDRHVPDPIAKRAYMINVASYRNGVGYGRWTHVDGFSESVLKWIAAQESTPAA
jgi:60 kDa SS-A/Ro ribonucleoprotein